MGMTSTLVLAYAFATATFDLPPGLISALCYTESNHRIGVVNWDDGGSPSLGNCQIKEEVAYNLGFKELKAVNKDGTPNMKVRRAALKELRHNPVTNAFYAGKLLRYQLDRYNQDPRKAVSAYNMGRYRHRRGEPLNKAYVTKVFRAWSQYK